MTTTCASCGAEVGDAAACPQCGHAVLSPQSAPPPPSVRPDWRTDTAERPAVRAPVEPAPAVVTPGPPRFPLYADETADSVEAHVGPGRPPAPPPATDLVLDDRTDDDYERRGARLAAVGDRGADAAPGRRRRRLAAALPRTTTPPRTSPAASVPASQETSDEPGAPPRRRPRSRARRPRPVGDRAARATPSTWPPRRPPRRRGGAPERGRLRQPHDVRRGQHARRHAPTPAGGWPATAPASS